MKPNYYTLVSHSTEGGFVDAVNKKLRDGYELYGSPFVVNTTIYQAMVKMLESERKPLSQTVPGLVPAVPAPQPPE